MSFTNLLEKIQSKPRYLRLQILWLAVFVCMFFIVSLWLVSLKYSLGTTAEKSETPVAEIKKEAPSLKEALKASIGAFFEDSQTSDFEQTPQENFQSELEEGTTSQEKVEDHSNNRLIKPAKLPLSL